jgi:bifunctional non-homologous end joining protein LigD
MLCKAGQQVPEGDDWVLEPKWDGHRVLVILDEDDEFDIRTRTGRSVAGKLPIIERQLIECLPPDTIVDGEVIAFNTSGEGPFCHPVGQVQSVMGSNRSDTEGELSLVIFDVLRLAGEDVTGKTWQERRDLLERMVVANTHVQLTPVADCREASHDNIVRLGFEGSVAKRKTSRYRQGARSDDWLKLKVHDTADVVVVGFKPGKAGSRWADGVGAFEVEILDDDGRRTGVFTTVKCGTDECHIAAHEHPEIYLGKVIEIMHMGQGESGKYRHPSFVRLRSDDDKQVVG